MTQTPTHTQINISSLSDKLLQLTSGSSSTVKRRLVALAKRLGKALGAQACWIQGTSPTRPEQRCFWSALPIEPDWGETSRVIWSSYTPSPYPTLAGIKTFTCANDTIVNLAHSDFDWQPTIPLEKLHLLLNTAAVVYSQLQLSQQLQYQQSIHDIFTDFNQTLKSTSNLEELFSATLEQLGSVLAIDRSFILLAKYPKPMGQSLLTQTRFQVVQQWHKNQHRSEETTENLVFLLTESPICLRAWDQVPKPLEMVQFQSVSDSNNVCDRWLDWVNLPQLLLIPLLGSAQQPSEPKPLILGFMGFQRQTPLPWSDHEQTLLDWMSSQISTVLIHRNTLEQVHSLVDARTAQLHGSLEVQARLYEKTRQQVEQLQEHLTLKNEFLDSVSHELRTPLTSMKVAMRMLRQDNLPPERQTKYFELLETEWQREYDLIENLLQLQKLESSASLLPLAEFSASVFIERLIEPFEQRWQPQGLNLEIHVPANLTLYSHADSLERIINELLVNAGKYAQPQTTVRLTVIPKDNTVEIVVHNWGQGISPEIQSRIFEKFFRAKGVTQRAIAGTGLGLAIVRALLKHLNGTIRVWSAPVTEQELGQAQFTITLPHNSMPSTVLS
ncbi:MAG: HAMP domain-containing histidine kinase [Spirulina sp. SIO3F2]|nr:HAMP domain-containing histidine kinase [Spirulina sp. SIO3F2]